MIDDEVLLIIECSEPLASGLTILCIHNTTPQFTKNITAA
jgi:hypothetical protein